MDRRRVLLAALAAIPLAAGAQASAPRKIAVIWAGPDKTLREYLLPGLRKALATAGLVERRHFELDIESTAEQRGLPAAAARLAARRPDLILAQGTAATRAMAAAAPNTPIVTSVADPVGSGFAQSLARPGGNITGLSQGAPEVSRKALEIIARLVPLRSRIAIVARDSAAERELAARVESAAAESGLAPYVEALPAAQLAQSFTSIDARRTPAVFLVASVEADVLGALARDAVRKKLVAACFDAAGAEAGFLLSVNARQSEYFERTAALLARIINGAKPADTPFESPSAHEVVLNRATARALHVTIPPDVAMRAERVVP